MDKRSAQVSVTAIILAGGQGTRLGNNNKGLYPLAGRAMIEHVLARIENQVSHIIISANSDLDRYRRYGLPVVEDKINGQQGPLAGLAASLPHVKTEYVLIVPCDLPALPSDLVARLRSAMDDEDTDMAVVHDGEQLQHLVALVRRHAAASVQEFLDEGGRAAKDWAARMFPAVAWFSDQAAAFRNVNTPEDAAAAEELLRGHVAKRGNATI